MVRQNKGDFRKLYRLALIDDQTHEKVGSVKISKLRLTLYSITVVLAVIFGGYAITAYTPIRTTIPGYPDYHSKRDAIANAIRIDSLESAIMRWELYSENLARVLAGEETLSLDSILTGNTTRYLRDKSSIELARQDSLLREIIHDEEQFEVSGKNKQGLPIEGMNFFTPVKGVVTQGFDIALHPYVEIGAAPGTVVKSILDGTVILVEWNDSEGYSIAIQHPSEIISVYSNNQKALKKVGDKVAAGTPVALSEAPSVRFSLWNKGEAIDAQRFIQF